MNGGHLIGLLGSLALLGAAAVLVVAETILTRLPHARAKALVDEGRSGAESLEDLLANRQRALNPVRLAVLSCQIGATVMTAATANSLFGLVGLALVTALDVVIIFLFAEAGPRAYALGHPDRAALAVAPMVRALVNFGPYRVITQVLMAVTNLVVPDKGGLEEPGVSEEELLAMADVAVEADVLEVEERTLIRSIIAFGDTVVREVMVPRPDMVTIPKESSVGHAMEMVIENGFSRVPVSGESIDDIVGMIYAKDLLRATRESSSEDGATSLMSVESLMREPRFVPETKRVSQLLPEMQKHKFHMAIVVDEHGSTAGLVTLEDLIEELVGEIVDEFDVEDPMLEPLPGGGIRVDARLPVDELDQLLQLDLPKGDWDTVGGLMLNLLGHPATEGESVDLDSHRLQAEHVQGRRIGRIRITPIAAPASQVEAESP